MKVLWFTTTPSLGARHLNLATITGGWIEAFEAEISKSADIQLGVVFRWGRPGSSPFIADRTKYYPIFNSPPGNKIKKLSQRWFPKSENDQNIQEYLKVIREFNPDIIHIFGTEIDFGLIIPKISIPCVIHIQGNLIVCNHKWFSGISFLDLLKYSKKSMLIKGYGFLHEYFFYKKEAERERRIFHDCRFFMGRTDWDKRITLSLSPGSKYFHCDEIMRRPFYSHRWSPKSSGGYTILTTIRNNIYKGLETLFECKKILQDCLPAPAIKWKIAGLKEEDEIAYLVEKKYRDTFINNEIHLLGSLQENELIDEMLKADLFIHPSHIDNSPNSVCEAMILGMPIISTYAGGIPSLIQDKKEGLLVQDGDPYALAGAVVELINNREYASTLGTNARQKALARHNREKIVEDVLKIYNSIIEKPASTSN